MLKYINIFHQIIKSALQCFVPTIRRANPVLELTMKTIAILISTLLITGCQTLPRYPSKPMDSPLRAGESVTSISAFPHQMYVMKRGGRLSQDPYMDYDGDLNEKIEQGFIRVYTNYFTSGLLRAKLSDNEEEMILQHVFSSLKTPQPQSPQLMDLLERTGLSTVFVSVPTTGTYTTLWNMPTGTGMYLPLVADRSLKSFVLDTPLQGTSIKCDARVIHFDLRRNKMVREIKLIDNWVIIRGIRIKSAFADYTDEEKEVIDRGTSRGIEIIWNKVLKKAF